MKAPYKAYKQIDGKLVRIHLAKGEESIKSLLGCFLEEYTSSPTLMQLMTRTYFHLDMLVLVEHKDYGVGFLGAVMAGGNNEKYHNLDKRASGYVVEYQGNSYRILNDAGLNTLGDCEIRHIGEGVDANPDNWLIFENYRNIEYTVKNAYYGYATWKLYAKKLDSDPYYEVQSGTLSPHQTIFSSWEGDIPMSPVPAGTEKRLSTKIEIVNDEGTTVVEKGPFALGPTLKKITVYQTDDRTDPWNTGEEMEVYVGENDYDTIHVVAVSEQDTAVSPDDLPDGGKVYRLVTGFVELTEGQYNVWNYSGFRYLNGRITYIYRPNSETSEPYWKVVVEPYVEKYGSDSGWPEAASSGYIYRISIAARFVAVAGMTEAPPDTAISNLTMQAVSETGLVVSSLQIDQSKWNSNTVLHLSDSTRSTVSDTYFYAKQIPTVEPAYGVMVTGLTIVPSDMVNEKPITALP